MAKVLGFTIEINGTQRAISTSEQLRRAIADVGKELKKATDVETIQKLEKELVDLKARQAEVNKETRESIKLQQQQLTAVDNTSGAYDKLSKELNEARKRYKDLAAAEQDSTEEAQQLIKRIVELDGKLKGVDASVGQFQRNVGNYPQFFQQFEGISQGINNVKNATTGTAKAVGGLLVAFEAFSLISATVAELNQNLEETKRISAQIQTFTGATGAALQDQVAQAKAVSETYKADVQEVSVAANTLSKELGVDFARALALIEAGFRKGADAQGEFLDGLREYPAQFRDAGASAEQFIAVSIAAANSGIYSDKGLDAVKEFGLRIREQTKATGDALRKALGSEFTDKLFSDLNKGAITTVDALGQVTRELKAVGVQGSELQTVIADVFGGPGEDVGQQFLFTLGDILETTDNVTQSTTAYQQQLGELYQANLDLELAQKGYNEALVGFSFELQVATTKGKTFLANILKEFLNFGNQLPATIAGLKASFQSLYDFEINPIKGIKKLFTSYNAAFKKEVRRIKDEDEIQKAVVASLEKPAPRIEKAAQTAGKTIAKETTKATKEELEKALAAQNLALEKAARTAFRAQISSIGEELQFVSQQLNTSGFADTILSGLSGSQVQSETSGLVKDIIKEFEKLEPQISDLSTRIFSPFSREVAKTGEDIANFVDKYRVEETFNAALDVIGAFQSARAEKEQEAFQQQIEQIDANILALEERQQNVGRIRAKQIQREIDAAKRQRVQAEKDAEEAQKKAAKKEKNLAIIQATVQGTLAVVRALAAPPGFPLNLPSVITTGVLAAAQVAAIAAQPLATGGIITGRRVTDNQNIPTRSNGDNVLATVKRGEVVLNERQQNALGGATTFRSIGVPGFAGGGIVPPITAPAAAMAGSGGGGSEILELIKATNDRIDRIKVLVVSEEIRADLREGDQLKAEATL